jgi:membrane-associated phospholipid phosphatase/tRNA A-37 threonylcarbamoyl transferase component Bud32
VDTAGVPPGRSLAPEGERRGARKRRRPSGEPPPLPRQLGRSGKIWIGLAAGAGAFCLVAFAYSQLAGAFDRWDTAVLQRVVSLRTGWLTTFARGIDAALGSVGPIRILRLGTIAALLVLRRWRHLLTFLISVAAVAVTGYELSIFLARSRPFGVTIAGGWRGLSFPSRPVAALAVTTLGMAYTLLPHGSPRSWGKRAAAVLVVLLGLARIYLAVDHPTDVVAGVILGVVVPLVAFRWFTPNDIYPVTYRGGKAAHLDVGGRRGVAIREALRDQLALDVLDVEPIGLEASGGSTPLRLRVAANDREPERFLFAKLYARSHVRADRWYKLGRTMLYGALEDETPFQSVRRFVEYEDYILLLLYVAGIPAPAPVGVVEITPEREYLIVMEFFEGALEIGEAEVDDRVIDDGLLLVRRLWDAGLAHRDVKPANLMVRKRKVLLIDVFFVQVRPSPWRQAVDLANMMLVLALRSDAPLVYEHALKYFADDEIAEAFAATGGVASPTQLRSELKKDGRDLLTEFRRLAPVRSPVGIQRWSIRRVALTTVVLLAALTAVVLTVENWTVFA